MTQGPTGEQSGNDMPVVVTELVPPEPGVIPDEPTMPAEQQEGITAEWDPTQRNRYLRLVSSGLTALERSYQTTRERQSGYHQPRDIDRQGGKVNRNLAKACGACGLSDSCSIARDLRAWSAIHDRETSQGVHPNGESRTDFLRRLKNDPQGHCIPPTETIS
jgi:hypothetical protein